MIGGINRLLKYVTFGLSLAAMAQAPSVLADASAIAYDSDNKFGWATENTQREANETALRYCNKVSSKKDCALEFHKAIARAEFGGAVSYARSTVSLSDARKGAVERCKNSKCKVVFETTTPGLYALARDSDNGGFYLAYNYRSLDTAVADAVKGCEENTGRACKAIWHGAIAGDYSYKPAPAVSSRPAKAVNRPTAETNCRPTTPTVRCSSQCTNGNCIVTYENGCKMRVQVPARFDSFNNQWNYPAPSC